MPYTFTKVHHDGRDDEVSLADDRGMTLCGFARRGNVNVYTHPERLQETDQPLELLL